MAGYFTRSQKRTRRVVVSGRMRLPVEATVEQGRYVSLIYRGYLATAQVMLTELANGLNNFAPLYPLLRIHGLIHDTNRPFGICTGIRQ